MKTNLKNLLAQKEALKRRIYIAEIGNDSYFLSPLYEEHQHQMHLLEKQIDDLQNKSDFSTDKKL